MVKRVEREGHLLKDTLVRVEGRNTSPLAYHLTQPKKQLLLRIFFFKIKINSNTNTEFCFKNCNTLVNNFDYNGDNDFLVNNVDF